MSKIRRTYSTQEESRVVCISEADFLALLGQFTFDALYANVLNMWTKQPGACVTKTAASC